MLLDSIKKQYAPDQRVALFEVESIRTPQGHILKGVTDRPEALETLREAMKGQEVAFMDSIELLPAASLADKTQGAIKLSVANIRSRPAHSAELVTQATLGMPVKILQKKGGWYRVQTPDRYLGWMDDGGLQPMDPAQWETWKSAEKLIFTQTYGSSHAQAHPSSQRVTDLVAGNILQLVSQTDSHYQVEYPDGRRAFVEKASAKPYGEWRSSLPMDREALVATSMTLLGVPYLWGGTSTKGVDCSGFTKTIYFMNGMIIPRDASQQIHQGSLVDDAKAFDRLLPGDLLFFGKKATDSTAERVIHVGMWIGNNQYIHSAGDVHISSVDRNSPNWDPYNYDRYLRTKRLLNQEDPGLLYLGEEQIF